MKNVSNIFIDKKIKIIIIFKRIISQQIKLQLQYILINKKLLENLKTKIISYIKLFY